jgi:type I restriction enzyme R subunit
VALIRAYAAIADELDSAGYTKTEQERLANQLDHYLKLREVIRMASGETIDLKAYEADMRHLIDTYIETSEPRKISPFDGLPLLEIIVKTGIGQAIAEKLSGIKRNEEAVAETIENNIRSKIIKEHLHDPAYYEKMSALLDEIIAARKAKAIEYEEYLKKINELARRVVKGQEEHLPDELQKSPGLRALYNNLKKPEAPANEDSENLADEPTLYRVQGDPVLALSKLLDAAVRKNAPAALRGVLTREIAVKRALFEILQDTEEVERIFPIIKQQPEY